MFDSFAKENSFATIKMRALNDALLRGYTLKISRSGREHIETRIENNNSLLATGIHSKLLSALERANNDYEWKVLNNFSLRDYCLEDEKEKLFLDISILGGDTLKIYKNPKNKSISLVMKDWYENTILFKTGSSIQDVLNSAETTLKGS